MTIGAVVVEDTTAHVHALVIGIVQTVSSITSLPEIRASSAMHQRVEVVAAEEAGMVVEVIVDTEAVVEVVKVVPVIGTAPSVNS